MAQVFNVNQSKPTTQYSGQSLFNLKTLAVSAGYTVVASGDGNLAYNPAGDVWLTGLARTSVAPAVPNDAGNASAWCVLGDASGRQILLQMTNAGGFTQGRAIIGVARAGAGGFDFTTANATTAPGSPVSGAGGEYFFFSSTRNGAGGDIFPASQNTFVHMWADTTPGVDGGLPLGFVVINADLSQARLWCVIPIVSGESSADIDPVVYQDDQNSAAWDWAAGPTYTQRFLNTPSASSFWPVSGQVDPITTADAITAPLWVTSTNECAKGKAHSTSTRMLPVTRGFGFYGLDQNGLGWCTGAVGSQYCFPWPAALPVPQP